jgi:hypothetical protein
MSLGFVCVVMQSHVLLCSFAAFLQVLRALAQTPALQDTQLIAFEQFCCHDTLSDLRQMPKDLWPAVHRINTHTYTSKHFFQHPLKLLLLWQVRASH